MKSLEEGSRAQVARKRAAGLIEDAGRAQTAARRLRGTPGACPLCVHPATVTDWRPQLDWIAIDDCSCGGFLVAAPILAERIRHLTARDRKDFASRIRSSRATGHEAWFTTTDGTVTGPLVVRPQRPDRPTEPPVRA